MMNIMNRPYIHLDINNFNEIYLSDKKLINLFGKQGIYTIYDANTNLFVFRFVTTDNFENNQISMFEFLNHIHKVYHDVTVYDGFFIKIEYESIIVRKRIK